MVTQTTQVKTNLDLENWVGSFSFASNWFCEQVWLLVGDQ